MIIYGLNSIHLKTKLSQFAVCPNCNNKEQIAISTFSKHFHIFWIPIFPAGKEASAVCQHCNHSMNEKSMPDNIKQESNELKSETKPPLWQFSGIPIIAILIALLINFLQNEKMRELEYLSSLKAGDIIEYKTETGNYSTFKLTDVTDDSVIYVLNNYEISTMSRIKDIDNDTSYSDELYIISIKELKDMYHNKTIFGINRK
jgi:hypothetical protein